MKTTVYVGKFLCLNVNIANTAVRLSNIGADITIREVKPLENAVNI